MDCGESVGSKKMVAVVATIVAARGAMNFQEAFHYVVLLTGHRDTLHRISRGKELSDDRHEGQNL